MLFRKEIRLEKDYIDCMIYVLFDANRPLTLDEITESVKKHVTIQDTPLTENDIGVT